MTGIRAICWDSQQVSTRGDRAIHHHHHRGSGMTNTTTYFIEFNRRHVGNGSILPKLHVLTYRSADRFLRQLRKLGDDPDFSVSNAGIQYPKPS